MRTYEGMFLLDSSHAVKDWDETVGVVTSTLERYGAEMDLAGKWDERKLAYPVKAQKRGTYYLAYFKAPTDAVAKVRADLLLREEVLRFLILAMPEDVPVPDSLEQKRMIQDDDDDRRRGGFGGRDRDGDDRDDRPRRRERRDDDSGSRSMAADSGEEGE